MKKLEIIQSKGVRYVIAHYERCDDVYPKPNFLGSGKALVGVLKKNETLEAFINKTKKRKVK